VLHVCYERVFFIDLREILQFLVTFDDLYTPQVFLEQLSSHVMSEVEEI
jgi:hypothetical protein